MAITLEINGVDKTTLIKKRSLNYTLRGDGIASASFVLNTTSDIYAPLIGQTVEVLDGITVLYGGLIKTVVKGKLTPAFGNTADIEVSVSCDGYNTIPSRRTVTYEAKGKTAGEIVEHLRSLTINAEGVAAGTIDSGITIPYYLAVCKSVAQIYDELAKASGYKWYIDKDKELYFIAEEAVVDADVELVESGLFTDFHNVVITETFKDYRNKTFVKGNFGVEGKLVVVSSEDAAEIAAREAIEGGTGVYGYVIESQEITTEADALALAELDVQKYAFAPADLQFSSYTTDWVPGTRLKVNLPALGIASDTYFLIDEVHVVRVDNDILKATIRATKRREGADFSTQRVQSGNDYFVELVREAKRKGNAITDGAGGGVIGSAVKSYYDTNAGAVNVDDSETLVVEKTFTMAVSSNIFISVSAKITAGADQNIVSKVYVTEPGEAAAALTYQPSHDLLNGGIYTLTHSDTVEAVSAGAVTIQVKMVVDTDDAVIEAKFGTLSIITVPELTVEMPEPEPSNYELSEIDSLQYAVGSIGTGNQESVVSIDNGHFIIAHAGADADGFIKTFSVDSNYENITIIDDLEHDTTSCTDNSLVKIDGTHFMLAYGETGTTIKTFSIDGAFDNITQIDGLRHDAAYGAYNSVVKIDATHFILAYSGGGLDGFIKTFSIDGAYGSITQIASLEHDTDNGTDNSLVMIDSTHFILAYAGTDSDGFIKTFSIDGSYGNITQIASLEHDTTNGTLNSLVMIDSNLFILAYRGSTTRCHIKTFSIDSSYGNITEIDSITVGGLTTRGLSLIKIDRRHHLLSHVDSTEMILKVLKIDYDGDNITVIDSLEHQTSEGAFNSTSLAQINPTNYLLAFADDPTVGATKAYVKTFRLA